VRADSLVERAAEALRFKDISDVLLWYVEARARKTNLPSLLRTGDDPGPELPRGARSATYTAIVGCLVERSAEDYPFDPKVTEERVEQLLHYYSSKKNPPRGAELEEVRRTRNVLRRRMKARGLLIGRSGSGSS
jgi:hypothetical protein